MKNLSIFIIFFIFLPRLSYAGTVNADSCSYADVNNAITSASVGDTVNVPSGSCTWSTALTINKGINLIGAGRASLTITHNAGSDFLITYEPSDYSLNTPFRLSGFSLNGNSVGPLLSLGVAKSTPPATIQTKIRVDNNRFTDANGQSIKHWGAMWGVVDSNLFEDTIYPVRANAGEIGGGIIAQNWWNNLEGITYGHANNTLYFEDNDISGLTSELGGIAANCQYGGRHSWRYNDITLGSSKYPLFDLHGEQPDGSGYCGCFGGEWYGNDIIGGAYNIDPFVDARGGKVLVFYNAVNGGTTTTRVRDKFPGDWCLSSNAQDEDVEDSYMWINLDAGSSIPVTFTNVTEDSEAWQYTNTFDGSSGIGCGTQATMEAITTCTENVGFWATSQSCSDLTNLTGVDPSTPISGTLYRCNGSNTWVSYYTPLTYPHPLRGENVSASFNTGTSSTIKPGTSATIQ